MSSSDDQNTNQNNTGQCLLVGLTLCIGINRYDHTDTNTNYPVWIHIKPIPIILFGFISN